MPYQEYAGVSSRPSTRLHLTLTLLFLAALLTPTSAWAEDCSPASELWGTNGRVNTIVCTSDAIYLGGGFTEACLSTGCWAPVSATTGQRIASFPRVYGEVHACVSDGAGGWYIGGSFTCVGELTRQNVAHILANGTVDPAWNPNSDWEPEAFYGEVNALALSGRRVYVGGRFSWKGGQRRDNIAALDAATGRATAWNPRPDSVVSGVAVSGGTVYVAGFFEKIDGQMRNRIAAFDAATGLLTAWNPNADGGIYALAVSGKTVYAGGDFHNIGGQNRYYIAALDAATGRATAWNPNGEWEHPTGYGRVYALALSGRRVYVGGHFSRIGGQRRNSLAALNATTGLATAWNPDAGDSNVKALAVSGGTVYAGGDFNRIGRQKRYCLAALDATTGLATAWNPNLNQDIDNAVNALAVSNGTVVVGGRFQYLNGQARGRVAALNPTTGAPTSWNPDADGPVNAMALSGDIIYVGGAFHHIGGKARNHLAAIDAKTGRATAWNPNADDEVNALAVAGGTIYAGGNFLNIGGQKHTRLAAISTQTGRASAWSPDPDGLVNALAVSGGTVYASGHFQHIGGKARRCVAALSAKTGLATAWNPNPFGDPFGVVWALAVAGRTIYVGGGFSRICDQPRAKLVAIDAATGRIPAAWVGFFGGGPSSIRTLLVSGGTVYAGSNYNRVYAMDATSGKNLGLNLPSIRGDNDEADNAVWALALSGGMLYFGGDFTTVNGQPQYHIARFRLAPKAAPVGPWRAIPLPLTAWAHGSMRF